MKSIPSAQRCPRHPSVLTYAWPYPYQLPAEITVPRFKDVHQHMVTNKVPDLVLGSSAGTDHLWVWTVSRKEHLSTIAASHSLSTALNVLARWPSPLPPALRWKPLAFQLSPQGCLFQIMRWGCSLFCVLYSFTSSPFITVFSPSWSLISS